MAIAFVALIFSMHGARAQTVTNYTNFASVSNGVVLNWVSGGGAGALDGDTVNIHETFDFCIPLLPAEYAITNAIFLLSGFIGGAAWGEPNVYGEIYYSIRISSTNTSHTPYFNSQSGHSDFPGIVAWGQYTIYTNAAVSPLFPPAWYNLGSPIDLGGYGILNTTVDVSVSADSFDEYVLYEDILDSELAFAGPFRLKVIYQLATNFASGLFTNLPPIASPDTNVAIIQQNSTGMPIPISTNVPDYVLGAAGLTVKGVQIIGHDVMISWNTVGGSTNFVQASSSLSNSNFADISGPIVVPGPYIVSTNFVEVGGATNSRSRFYRIRSGP